MLSVKRAASRSTDISARAPVWETSVVEPSSPTQGEELPWGSYPHAADSFLKEGFWLLVIMFFILEKLQARQSQCLLGPELGNCSADFI